MIELAPIKKTKITLADYDYKKDIQNRLFMAHFTELDLQILEEIIFSPLKISSSRLAKHLDLDKQQLFIFLEKYKDVGLLTIENDCIFIDKEMRKYYEFQIKKFDPDFKPDMEFLQDLLKKVPIHLLPTWYAIGRTSDNIFQSILEKYLDTPLTYQRYLIELQNKDPIFAGIIKDVHQANDFKVSACVLKEKYDLSTEEFEEYMLLLEFSFACCLIYSKVGTRFEEVVTPFYEWQEYLKFLKKSLPTSHKEKNIQPFRKRDFAFIEDLSYILNLIKKESLVLENDQIKLETLQEIKNAIGPVDDSYIQRIITKLCLIQFVEKSEDFLLFQEKALEWLTMSLEYRALHYYRHPLNQLLSFQSDPRLCIEKNIRKAEKCICRALHGNWVLLEDVLNGSTIAFGKAEPIRLKNKGKHWCYELPIYSQPELELIKSAVFEGLFEAGIVAIGMGDKNNYFRVTSFGKSLFEV